MRRSPPGALVAAGALALCLAASAVHAQDAEAGANVFKRCAVCHKLDGTVSLGPPLDGVVGRKAASVASYAYSEALSKSGIIWDEMTLDTFLAKPRALVPGVKMAFAGLPRERDRQDVIAYLATFKQVGKE